MYDTPTTHSPAKALLAISMFAMGAVLMTAGCGNDVETDPWELHDESDASDDASTDAGDADVDPGPDADADADADADLDAEFDAEPDASVPLEGFVTVWNTENDGVSDEDQIALPLHSAGTYDFTV